MNKTMETSSQIVHEAYAELNQFTKKCVDLLEKYAKNHIVTTDNDNDKAEELIEAFTAHWQDGLP